MNLYCTIRFGVLCKKADAYFHVFLFVWADKISYQKIKAIFPEDEEGLGDGRDWWKGNGGGRRGPHKTKNFAVYVNETSRAVTVVDRSIAVA